MLFKHNDGKNKKVPWRVKDEREVIGRLISAVLRQVTDCCSMTDREKKKDRQKHRKGRAPYGETKGYEISSKMHFS